MNAGLDVPLEAAFEGNSDSDFEIEVKPSTSKSVKPNVNKWKGAAPTKNLDTVKPKRAYRKKNSGKCSDKLKFVTRRVHATHAFLHYVIFISLQDIMLRCMYVSHISMLPDYTILTYYIFYHGNISK